jgi:hypothetical protein
MPPSAAATAIAPVYIPWATFLSGVQSLRDQGLPDVIDRTAWRSRSGADQSGLMSAFRFLGLIDEDGKTQTLLRSLVSASPGSDQEKQVLLQLLRVRYAAVFALDLSTATPGALKDAVKSFGDFSTLSRAVRFFLKAAGYSGVTLSPRLASDLRERRARNGGPKAQNEGGATRKRRKSRAPEPTPAAPPAEKELIGGAMKTVTLPEVGGTVTLAGTFNAFLLNGEERTLIYKIIDLMNEFENGVGRPKP